MRSIRAGNSHIIVSLYWGVLAEGWALHPVDERELGLMFKILSKGSELLTDTDISSTLNNTQSRQANRKNTYRTKSCAYILLPCGFPVSLQ